MARASAANAVADALVALINVSSVRALCPGGVSRNRHRKQAPPYISVGPCREQPDDTFGTAGYGAVVSVPVHVITTGEDVGGDSRAYTIAGAVLALVDEPVALSVTGWSVRAVEWQDTVGQVIQFEDGLVGYDVAVTVDVTVRKA